MILPQRVTPTLVTPLRTAEEPTVLAHRSYYSSRAPPHRLSDRAMELASALAAATILADAAVTPQSPK